MLLAAGLHATWNAVAKASSDPLINIGLVTATGGAVAAVALPFVGAPGWQLAPYLAASVVLHLAYQLFLVRSYQLGDLSQVYPIARGAAPLGVALLAFAAGEVPTPLQGIGLVLACAAITSLALGGGGRRASGRALASALATALLISVYTVVDGLGVRARADALCYIAWMFFLDGIPMLSVAWWRRRGDFRGFCLREGRTAVTGGLLATLGYGLVLWALSRGAMAPVAALRETSVIFAAAIGTAMLGEPFGARRVLAACVLVLGLALVQV